MALKVYIGARYTPKFEGAWSNSKAYSALSVVYRNNKSYVSRKTVPAGTLVTNTEFWIESADWNAQVAQYNQNVTQYKAQVDTYQKSVESYTKQVNQFYADTLHSYETRDEMIADTNIKLGDTLLTCGKDAIGDGGGSFYQVVDTQSQKTVILANGLYAEPFEFQPYDYAAFERQTEKYKAEVDAQLDEVEKYSLRNYDTANKMIADRSLQTGNTVLTSGENSVGDGQGSFWKVVDQSTSTSTALANGKFAQPFQLNPYEVSNRVTDNLNPDFKTGIPPCVWAGTVHGNGVNITLGALPSHKQEDGSYKVDCTIFLNASFETTTERTSTFSVIHGGYAGLPALTYKFDVSGKNGSAESTKTELIAVRLMTTYKANGYISAKGSNTIVTSWNSIESNIDYNAPSSIVQVQTTADSAGLAYGWTGLPRTNSFFMPITAKKDGYTLTALHFTAGGTVSNVDDALWTITFTKYDDSTVLHTSNFYAVNGTNVDYNVNIGFALAKGTTYKMTFSGPSGAKLNFPTVASASVQTSEDIDVKTAPGYWQDNNTVVFSGTVELSTEASSSSDTYYTSTTPVVEWPSSGTSHDYPIGFNVKSPIMLSKINLKVHVDNEGGALNRVTVKLVKYTNNTTGTVLKSDLVNVHNTTVDIGIISYNEQLDAGLYALVIYSTDSDKATMYVPTNYGSLVTNKSVEGVDGIVIKNVLGESEAFATTPLVAQVTTSTYSAQTVVVYGDSKQTTSWTTESASPSVSTYFELKQNTSKLNIQFNTTIGGVADATIIYWAYLMDESGTTTLTRQSLDAHGPKTSVNISLNANNITAGIYQVKVQSGNLQATGVYRPKTTGTITNNNYINAKANEAYPTLAKFTITV